MVAEPSAAFFVSGGTVPLGAASYVGRAADRELLEALREGRYAYVLTSRQMGKSSLSVRTMEALRIEGVRTAFLDLTRIGGRNVTPDQWYAGLLGEIGRGLGDRAALLAHWKAHPEIGPMQRFFGALREVALAAPAPLVVFIDEIDATKSLPFSTDEFFAGIRECFNRRVEDPAMARLAFCLIGVAIPSDLMSDAKLTPFNVGERIVLRDFSPKEARALAAGLGAAGGAMVDRIVFWTGGHPFLTQSLCRRLAEIASTSTLPSPRGEGSLGAAAAVDRLVAAEFFEARARETNINLADVGNRVLNSYDDPEAIPKYRSDVLSLYESVLKGRKVPDDESNRLVAVLKLSGLVSAVDGRLKVRNRVYERVYGPAWIEEHMPNQELRRQQRAFRLGMIRVGAGAAAMLAVVSALAVAAVGNADAARRAEGIARTAEAEATRGRIEAVEGRTEADRERRNAQAQSKEAERQRDLARGAESRAKESAKALQLALGTQSRLSAEAKAAARSADGQRRNALTQKALAEANAQAAGRATREATAQTVRAKRQTRLAVAAGKEANRQSYEAYVNGVQSVDMAIEANRFPLAQSILRSFRESPWRGWEYDHLSGRALAERTLSVTAHEGTIASVAFAEGGTMVVSSGYDGKIATWQASDAVAGMRFPATPSIWLDINDLAMLPSGHELVNLCGPGRIARYDLRTGRYSWYADTGDKATNSLAVAPDGKLFATCAEGGRVRLWQTSDGNAAGSFKLGDADLNAIAFSPDGRLLAAAATDGKVLLSDVQGHVRRTLAGAGLLAGVAFSPDGRFVAAGGIGGTVRVWDAEGGAKATEWTEASDVYSLACAPAGDAWGVVTASGAATLRDARNGALLDQDVPATASNATSLAFSPDGESMAIGGRDGGLRIWALHTRKAQPIERRYPNQMIALASDARSNLVVESHEIKDAFRLSALDLDSGKTRWERDLPLGTYFFMDLSRDARRIAFPSKDRKVLVLDAKDGRTLLSVPGYFSARFSPDGRGVATTNDDGIRLYDVATGVLRRTFPHARRTIGFAFSPDGGTLATGSDDGAVRLWSLRSDAPPVVLSGHSQEVFSVAYDAEGRRLISTGPDGSRIWDVRTRLQTRLLRIPGVRGETAEFLPDGERVVMQTRGPGAGTTLWDARTGRELVRLEGSGDGRAISIVDEGRILAGYIDGTLHLYEGLSAKDREVLRERQRQEDRRVAKQRAAEALQVRTLAADRERTAAELPYRTLVAKAQEATKERRFEDALSLYAKVLAERPDLASVRWARAGLLASLQRYAEAYEDYRLLDRREPDGKPSFHQFEYALLAHTVGRMEVFNQTLDQSIAETSEESLKGSMQAIVWLTSLDGTVLSPANRAKLERAVAKMSDDTFSRFTVANLLVGRGRDREALPVLRNLNFDGQTAIFEALVQALIARTCARLGDAAGYRQALDEMRSKRALLERRWNEAPTADPWTQRVLLRDQAEAAERTKVARPPAKPPQAPTGEAETSVALGTLGSLLGLGFLCRRFLP